MDKGFNPDDTNLPVRLTDESAILRLAIFANIGEFYHCKYYEFMILLKKVVFHLLTFFSIFCSHAPISPLHAFAYKTPTNS